MKIYVAGKFESKGMILEIYEKLKRAGHEISYDWTGHKNIKPYPENQDLGKQYSENEVRGILNADVFIYISHERGTTSIMEFGAALALKKRIGKPLVFVVGDCSRSPWFFNVDVKRADSIEDVLEELKAFNA